MLFYVMREAVGKTLLNLIKLKITKLKLKEFIKIENSARLFFDPLFDFFYLNFFLANCNLNFEFSCKIIIKLSFLRRPEDSHKCRL